MDLFPGYPDHLMMPRDLANFVSSLHVYAFVSSVGSVCAVQVQNCPLWVCLSTRAVI